MDPAWMPIWHWHTRYNLDEPADYPNPYPGLDGTFTEVLFWFGFLGLGVAGSKREKAEVWQSSDKKGTPYDYEILGLEHPWPLPANYSHYMSIWWIGKSMNLISF